MPTEVRHTYREIFGQGYDELLKSMKRYNVIKGSRNSKKSETVARLIILTMLKYKEANVLVVRKIGKDLKDSCYAKFEKFIYKIGKEHEFQFKSSPLEIVRLATGQRIMFRGLDEPQKISSIDVAHGCLCTCWIEEAYQIVNERDFDLLDQALRGQTPPYLPIRFYITFNPWNRSHFLRLKFFENEDGTPKVDPDILAMTTTYKINEWASEQDIKFFERMKELNPQLYQVAGLGQWGNPEGLIFNNWEEKDFDIEEIRHKEGIQAIYGLDFGWEDPVAFSFALVRQSTMEMWVCDDEPYASHMDLEKVADILKERGYRKKNIICDSAQPGDIDALRQKYDIPNAIGCVKYPGSVLTEIRRLQGYRIYIHPKCTHAIEEFQTLAWYVDKQGHTIEKEAPFCPNHFVASLRYASESIDQGNGIFLGEVGGEVEKKIVDDMSKPPSEREEDAGQTLCVDIGGSDDYDEDDDDSPMTLERKQREDRRKQQKDEGDDLFFEL